MWAVFGQTLQFDFVNYDDNQYVYDNPHVSRGLTFNAIGWAFTHVHSGNWHPLTTLTHMFDCQLYGLHPWGHHLGNVLLHATAVVLLFFALRQLTGAVWRSAFVAAVFAFHPLHVESVAWISERKDVLSGLFFMLTLMAYGRYARQQKTSGKQFVSPVRYPAYWVALLLFALGLLSKPMLVTLPFVLLLLDWWPLQRVAIFEGESTVSQLAREKIPFLLLSAASAAVTIWAQANAELSLEKLTFPLRVGNAFASYAAYLRQMFYPAGLAVFYPHPAHSLEVWKVGVSILLLLLISVGVAFGSRKHPYLPVGWLWYLGMLVPVIGLVQVGSQAMADRYSYLPQIGLYIIVAWGAVDFCGSWRQRRVFLGTGAVAILASLLVLAHVQATYWKSSISLWTHALACTSESSLPHNDLGFALTTQGKLAEGIQHFERALQLKPDYAEAYNNLGYALGSQGKLPQAIQDFERAIELKPDYAEAHNNLGLALAIEGKLPEGIEQCRHALQLKPDYAEAHNDLGFVLASQGKLSEAIQHYEHALELKPDYVEALNNLAYLLATSPDVSLRNAVRSIALSQHANQLTGGRNPVVLGTLAAAYGEGGRYHDAVDVVTRAIEQAAAAGNSSLVNTLESNLQLYKAHTVGPAQ